MTNHDAQRCDRYGPNLNRNAAGITPRTTRRPARIVPLGRTFRDETDYLDSTFGPFEPADFTDR
ncbi:MAG: hypothetical protein ACR2KJ_11180 [Jatrophihabitans sp.]